jgi:hypothetical protein
MSKKLALTLFSFALIAVFAAPSVASAQCRNNPDQGKAKLKSNEFYKVVSPNQIKFRPGVYFELVKSQDGKEFLRYGKMSNGKLSSVQESSIDCVCHCSDGDCTTTISGGNATCRGGCYDGGDPCTSCHFDIILEQ